MHRSSRSRGAAQVIRLSVVSALGRAPAFLIPVVIAAVFGAGPLTDAYFIAYSGALFVGGTVAQALEQAIVPFASREIARPGGGARSYFDAAARRAVLVVLLLWTTFVLLMGIRTAIGGSREALLFSMVLAPLAIGWCAAAVYGGALVSQWRIGTATGSLIFRGLGALAGFALVPLGTGLWAVAAGLGLGELFRTWWLRRRLTGLVPDGGGEPASLQALGRSARSQVMAGAAIGAAPFLERLIATSLGAGAVSHLEYAMRLLVVPAVLFEGALAPQLLARWSHETAAGSTRYTVGAVLRPVARGMALAVVLGVVIAVGGDLAVRLLLEHGRFTGADAAVVSRLLRWLSIGFVATMGALLLERFYLARAKNSALARFSAVRVAIRLLAVWLLLPSHHLLAFAFAYAIADWLYLAALVAALGPMIRDSAPTAGPATGAHA